MSDTPNDKRSDYQRRRHEAAAEALVEVIYTNTMSLSADVRSGSRLTPGQIRKLNQARREIEYIVEEQPK